MRKVSILKRKMARAYRNKINNEYSLYKGYTKGTYFGFETLAEMQREYIKWYREFYGYSLRNLIFI